MIEVARPMKFKKTSFNFIKVTRKRLLNLLLSSLPWNIVFFLVADGSAIRPSRTLLNNSKKSCIFLFRIKCVLKLAFLEVLFDVATKHVRLLKLRKRANLPNLRFWLFAMYSYRRWHQSHKHVRCKLVHGAWSIVRDALTPWTMPTSRLYTILFKIEPHVPIPKILPKITWLYTYKLRVQRLPGHIW